MLATKQFAYSVVDANYGGAQTQRFQSLVLTPRCSLTATHSDPRGLTTEAIESQAELYVHPEAPPVERIGFGAYERDYKASLGYCLPISEAEETWSSDDGGEAHATVAYSYDALNQLRKVDYPLAEADRAAISVDYDLHGRMTEIRDPDSGCTQFAFDTLHNLTERKASGYEADPEKSCDATAKPAEIRLYGYAADRISEMTYISLGQSGGEEDQLDKVSFFYDRYPFTTLDGEILEAPKMVSNDHANRRFVNVTGKICENCVGQVSAVTDRTGARSFAYSELGQVKKETRSVVAPVTDAVLSEGESEAFVPEVAFYELENSYTSFGDLTLQEFNESVPTNPSTTCVEEGVETCIARFTIGTSYAPDGDVAVASFNGQPLIRSARDELSRPAIRMMSDGTTSGYYYDPFDLRLNQMATVTAAIRGGANVPVQIAGYQYDGGGNVASYRNVADILEDYRSRFSFAYDGANRLTAFLGNAQKSKDLMEAKGKYTYDLGHRFTSRYLSILGDPGTLFDRRWTYNYNNTPGPRQPVHAPEKVDFAVVSDDTHRKSHLVYDDVGRMAKVRSEDGDESPGALSNRSLAWDAAGRLKAVRGGPDGYWTTNAEHIQEEYIYDFGGNRTLKINRPSVLRDDVEEELELTTIYLTPFYARPADSRGTVQISRADLPVASLAPPTNENAEPLVTYLYPDLRVGSVTASVMAAGELADADSTLIARREYSPVGLELTSNRLAAPENPLRPMPSVYHGKELDRTTGFSSFGARYYSRDLGFWTSPDPKQYDYLFGSPNGGAYVPRNLSTYAFAGQNPVAASDPDGQILDTILDVGFIIYDVGAIVYDEFATGGANRAENIAALGGDLLGAITPFATGGGIAVRGGIKVVDKGADVARSTSKGRTAFTKGKQFSSEKQALVDMAKRDKRTGITADDMQAYKDLNKELPDPFPVRKVRGPEAHPSRPHGKEPHGHVGPVDHIPIKD